MKKALLIASWILLSSNTVLAGQMALTCKNKSDTIRFNTPSVGDLGEIEIHYSKAGKNEVFKGDVIVKPTYTDEAESSQQSLLAIPIGNSKSVSEKCEQMRVVQADGSECFGRQAWEIVYQQNYLLTTISGNPLMTKEKLGENSLVAGKTDSGYIQTSFTCANVGITTAGGCFIEEDSKTVEWVEIDCDGFSLKP